MEKNIKKNYLLQVKKILKDVDKARNNAHHFRAVILMGDQRETDGFFYVHAPQPDIEKLVLNAMKSNDIFAYSVARAFDTYCTEVTEVEDKNNKQQSKSEENEGNKVQETETA